MNFIKNLIGATMETEIIDKVLSSPVKIIRNATAEERQIFADKENAWQYIFELECGQQFVVCLFKEENDFVNFRPLPKHNLLPNLKEISWGYDDNTYFGPGPDERRLVKIRLSDTSTNEEQKYYEKCLGAKIESVARRYCSFPMGEHAFEKRIKFSHQLRDTALELKKYLMTYDKTQQKLQKLNIEVSKAQNKLQWAKDGLHRMLVHPETGTISKILHQKQKTAQENQRQ